MKISILSFDLSHNCLGRAHLLAKVLSKKYDVEILGPKFGKGIWEPVKNDNSIKYTTLPIINIPNIFKKIDGDVIYAIKPKGTSFSYGLIKKFISQTPLILDIDDWELGFFLDYKKLGIIKDCVTFWNFNNFFYTFLLEKLIKFADNITVSSSFLQKKFGGVIIPHVRDTDFFNPQNYDRNKLREKFGIQNKKVIMFFGTIRKHKGIDDLISAIDFLKDKNIVLMLVGVDKKDHYVRELENLNKKYIKFISQQPFEKIPEFLSMADLVVLPQKNSHSARGQVPAKVFDAMAMGKPIISTNISDLPKILKNCGIIIKCGDVKYLANKIRYIFDNPKIARELGGKARRKCIKEYSFKAIEPKLFKIFGEYDLKSIK
ncbi:glycosyltransferase family 4 protein [Patescibacteria group bacterium]|nr:glycosyltransferase family 4 protein [Patescibacteria group bacterium]